ncbi:MAG: type II toxin-antitoxin system VapC family toxin [Planctomycetota bacterium]
MIFVDTWAWIALAVRRDQYHDLVQEHHRRLRETRRPYVTTDFVLSELITHLYRTQVPGEAQAFIKSLFESADKGTDQVIYVSSPQFQRAWQLRQKYHDKPGISFVDFTSMVVMQELGITEVFTGDTHFQQVGLGFRLVP